MKHVDAKSDRIRRVSEAARAHREDTQLLQHEFSRQIGRRTFHLLRSIGQESSSTFATPFNGSRVNTVRTSKPLHFELPSVTGAFSLRLEVNHHPQTLPAKLFVPRDYFSVGAQLSRTYEGKSSSQSLQLRNNEYVNGISVDNNTHYSRGAVPEYTERTTKFIRLLDFTEQLLHGEVDDSAPSHPGTADLPTDFLALNLSATHIPQLKA